MLLSLTRLHLAEETGERHQHAAAAAASRFGISHLLLALLGFALCDLGLREAGHGHLHGPHHRPHHLRVRDGLHELLLPRRHLRSAPQQHLHRGARGLALLLAPGRQLHLILVAREGRVGGADGHREDQQVVREGNA